jgi:hypothetical protein
MSDYEITAVVISIFSLSVSFLVLGWNIYRDIVLKPRLKVSLSISKIVSGTTASALKIAITVVNYGNRQVTCNGVYTDDSTLWKYILRKKINKAFILEETGMYGQKLPHELDVGRSCSLLIPFNRDCFFSKKYTRVGVGDVYGRIHWVPKNEFKKAKEQYQTDFGKEKYCM